MTELTDLLAEAAVLCLNSGYPKQAQWFRDRIQMLNESELSERLQVLEQIQDILAGMGSFSDLSLSPSPDSGKSREQARLRQWDLVSEIYDAIERIKQASNNRGHGNR